jgi:hypothetical protein
MERGLMGFGRGKKIRDVLLSLFVRKILFLGPHEIRLYRQKAGEWVLEKREAHPQAAREDFPKHAVMVVGREHYFEVNHLSPIASSRDLSKAVGLQAPSLAPREYSRYASFFNRQEKGTLVNLWFFNPELQEWVDRFRPMAIFPEGALPSLSRSQDGPILYYSRRWGQHLLSFRKERGDLISRLTPEKEGEETAMLSFRRLAGHDAAQARELFLGGPLGDRASEPDYFAVLAECVRDVPLRRWPRFLCYERFKGETVGRPLLYYLAMVFLLFFFLPPAVSFMHARSVHEDLSVEEKALKEKVGPYLDVRDETDKKRALIQKLSPPLREYVPRTLVVSELSRLLHAEEDILQSIQVTGFRMEIRGETRSSSDLLSRLGQSDRFRGARLSSPVMKDPKSEKERFVIEVTLVPSEAGD